MDVTLHIDGVLYTKVSTVDLGRVGDDTKAQFSADVAQAIMATPAAVGTPAAPENIANTVAMMVWMGYCTLNETQLATLVDLQMRGDRCDKSLISMVCKCKVSVINALAKKTQAALDAEAKLGKETPDA